MIIGDKIRVKDGVTKFGGLEGMVKEIVNTPFVLVDMEGKLTYLHMDYIEVIGTTGEASQ